MFLCLGVRGVGRSGVLDQRGTLQTQRSLGSNPTRTAISVAVEVTLYFNFRANADLVRFTEVRDTRWMHMQHPDHGHRLRNLELNVISQTYQHGTLDYPSSAEYRWM